MACHLVAGKNSNAYLTGLQNLPRQNILNIILLGHAKGLFKALYL